MSGWNGKAGSGASAEFVHVDGAAGASSSDKSSSVGAQKSKPPNSSQRGRGGSQANGNSSNGASNWQSAIARVTDPSKPEDIAAIRRLGEDVRAAGNNGARGAVDALRARIQDKNATAETRTRAIAVARVLAQRSISGTDAQRAIAMPNFVAMLKQVASDPNVRASLKTWASQIRIGDPGDATILTPITGLDEHLEQASENVTQSPESTRRPSLNPNGSYMPHASVDEDLDEDVRAGVRVHTTGNRTAGESMAAPGSFSASMPGGFGLDEAGTPIVATGPGGLPSVREFPPSSIQPIPPPLGAPRQSFGSMRAGWGEEDDGMQSDAPSTRSRRAPTQPMQNVPFVATPSMDGGREARDRLNGQGRGHLSRTSSLVDGTLSDPEESNPRGRHPPSGIPMAVPEDPRQYGQHIPAPMQQQRARSRHPSVSPDRRGFRSRSPSPSVTNTTRSQMTSRSRAQSRRRGAGPGTDPAAVLVTLAGVQFVRVVQEYYAAREGELTLREGDVLAVVRHEDGGRYWLGHSQGQIGRFPAHAVELLSHQSKDSAVREEKTTELLRRSREIENFMDQLHDFDITRYCITEDRDIQADLAGLMGLRNELVRHLDETTTGLGRLKAMLNKIKEAQRVHDRMIDSRIASYTARSSLHDNTHRNPYQELPANPMQYAQPPFDMSQYMRRTSAPQQIEQPPPVQSSPARQQPQLGMYNSNPAAALRYRQAQEIGYGQRPSVPPRARTYSYAPANTPGQGQARRMEDEQSSAYVSSEPTTPGEAVGIPPTMGAPPVNAGAPQYGFPGPQTGGERWGEQPKDEPDASRQRGRGGSHVASEASAHTHASRRNGF